jgi:hypothetical protein
MIRGATYEIEIIIYNDAGTVVNLTGVSGILVGLYGEGRKMIGKWSYVDKSAEGYGDVTVVDAPNGKIRVLVEADDTIKSLDKMAKLEVKVAFPNILFDGGQQISIDTEIEIEKVERSIFEGASPL